MNSRGISQGAGIDGRDLRRCQCRTARLFEEEPLPTFAGTTSNVTLCAGTVSVKALVDTSPTRVIAPPASCQRCAAAPAVKFATLIVAAAVPFSALLTIMIVNAPSVERTAAKAATLSGSGPVAATLTSPNADFAPSYVRYICMAL